MSGWPVSSFSCALVGDRALMKVTLADRSTGTPSGYVGAAFRVSGLLVWGFTAGLLDRLLLVAGWEEPWDQGRFEELPPEMTGAPR